MRMKALGQLVLGLVTVLYTTTPLISQCVDPNDVTPPILASSPTDITISCQVPLNLEKLDHFGSYNFHPDFPEENEIDDPGQDPNPTTTNGAIMDQCADSLNITDPEIVDQRGDCGMGNVLRIFTIEDARSSTTIMDTQTITIENFIPFTEKNIEWPEHTSLETCDQDDAEESITGKPKLTVPNSCAMPMFNKSDMLFDDPNSGCVVIERTWRIIDWCQYDADTKEGSWTYRQYIKLLNTVAPTFDALPDTIELSPDGVDCTGATGIMVSATDDCTEEENLRFIYQIDLDSNGDREIMGIGDSIIEPLPEGKHIVYWQVTDRCSNVDSVNQVLIIKEGKSPTPVCLQGIVIAISTDSITEIWASDFDASSSDNCTSREDLVFAFSENPEDGFRKFSCDDIGTVDLEVYVFDEAGNYSYCLTSVDVQDNLDICGDGGNRANEQDVAAIEGAVLSEMDSPISGTQINISGPEMDDYKMTSKEGKYAFKDLPTQYQYEIIPTKDDNPLAGVTTLDLVRIQRHILGITPLDSPFKMIAADVNNSESITATDLIQLRKLILGIYDHFPENNSWRFVETQFGLLQGDEPWPFVEGMLIPNLDQDLMEGDFIGVKIGDVDNTVEDELQRGDIGTRSHEMLVMEMENLSLSKGDVEYVTMTFQSVAELVAMQWTMSLDDEKAQIINWSFGDIPAVNEQVAIIQGEGEHLTMAWSDIQPFAINEGDIVITLTIKALSDFSLKDVMRFGSTITEAAAFASDGKEYGLEMDWIENSPEIVLYQNAPNPFLDRTSIAFDLDQDAQATIMINDVSGKEIFRNTQQFYKGSNAIEVTADELHGGPGVVYYTLQIGEQRLTKKMIIVK